MSAGFASMPTRTAVHSSTVNSEPRWWDEVHLIRCISLTKGLLTRSWDTGCARLEAARRRCDPVIRL
ncbi:hypothetical protein CNQ36_13850 [Streptomyces fungicidicus]|uniref:Uncharacterized protein n=1 Tax=Streptomyces fungicidicus TaxID=68203 RepID=A0A494V2K9_9ACTN|nr:hypothetical protein CNQ36_13850 [Streptomyces fungicidicus]